jgi:hypothetical protein
MAIRPLNSVAGFSVGETPTSIILANGDITTTNITMTGVSNLNSIGNVRISGGSAGQVITTDGSGNLSFVSISTSGLTNGTSNISVLNSGNITFSVAGAANVGVFTNTGLNVSGTLNATGNANVGNIGATTAIFTTGNIATINSGLMQSGNSNVTITANGNVTLNAVGGARIIATSAGANVTGTLGVSGNISAGNIGVGSVTADLVVANNISATQGIGAGLIAAGNSNITLTPNGNISLSATGSPNELVITSTGVNVTGTLNATGNANVGNIGATRGVFTNIAGEGGNISNIQGANVSGAVASATSATTAGTVTTNAQPNITSVGTLTSLAVTGNVTAANFVGTLANGNSDVSIPAANGNINFDVAGNANVVVMTGTGINVAGTLNATGNANVGNLGTARVLASANITAPQLISNVADGTAPLVVTSTTRVANLNVNYANVADFINVSTQSSGNAFLVFANALTGNVSETANAAFVANTSNGALFATTFVGSLSGAATTAGTVTTNAQPNITSVGTLTSLSVTGNVAAGNLTTTGVLSVTGTGVSSIAGNLDMTSNNIINLATPVNDGDAATKAYVDNLVSSGIHYHEPVRVESPIPLNATYNNGSNGVGATLTNAGTNAALVIDGVSLNVADRVLIYQQTNQTQNGVYVVTTVGDGSTPWVLTRASDADTYSPSTSTGLDEGSYFFVRQGETGAGESYVVSTVGTIVFGTTNITFAQFSQSQVYSAGTGLSLTNTTFSVNSAQPTITSVGTLSGLGVNGNIIAANITANTGSFTGNGSGLTSLNASNLTTGTVPSGRLSGSYTINISGSATTAGTVTTNAQPNITSVGTLTSLSVTGNANVGNLGTARVIATGNISGTQLISNIATGTAPLVVTSTTQVANLNVATAGSATTAGTVTTNAQPNITSVGTLTSLAVTGNITSGNISGTNGNLTTANISGSVVLGNSTVTTAISYGSVTTSAITANQTIASFSATGVTGVEFLVKSIDSTGSKYGVATVVAVTDGTNVDYSTFATVNLGGYTGALAVNIVGGQVRLQVTPASSNSTVWTTQYRLI